MEEVKCPTCENIDPTYNHCNSEGEWVSCDTCKGAGYISNRNIINALEAEGFTVITDQEPQQCDLCGKIAELRPYGPNGESICFECGMKDEETTKRKFEEYLG